MPQTPKNNVRLKVLRHYHGESLRAVMLRAASGNTVVIMANRLVTLILGIVLGRSLGVDGYGVYAYAFAVMGLLTVPAEVGVPTLLMREMAAREANREWGLLRGAFVWAMQVVGLFGTVTSLIGMLALSLLGSGFNHESSYSILLMLLILPLAATLKASTAGIKGLRHIVLGEAILSLLWPFLALILVGSAFVAMPALRQPHYALAGQLIAVIISVVVSLYLLWRIFPSEAQRCPSQYQNVVWIASLPAFALISGSLVIYNQVDLVMLGWFRPSADVGIYRVSVQGALFVAIGLQIANSVVAPHFTRLQAQEDIVRLNKLIVLSIYISLLAAIPLVLIFVVAGGDIVAFVFGEDFRRCNTALTILALTQLISAGFGSIGLLLTMTGQEKYVARALLYTILLNVTLNFIMIPAGGIIGAASATLVSTILLNVLLYRKAKQQLATNCGGSTLVGRET